MTQQEEEIWLIFVHNSEICQFSSILHWNEKDKRDGQKGASH